MTHVLSTVRFTKTVTSENILGRYVYNCLVFQKESSIIEIHTLNAPFLYNVMLWGLPLITYVPRGRGGGDISIEYYMQKR